jgi:hypothetical protein
MWRLHTEAWPNFVSEMSGTNGIKFEMTFLGHSVVRRGCRVRWHAISISLPPSLLLFVWWKGRHRPHLDILDGLDGRKVENRPFRRRRSDSRVVDTSPTYFYESTYPGKNPERTAARPSSARNGEPSPPGGGCVEFLPCKFNYGRVNWK